MSSRSSFLQRLSPSRDTRRSLHPPLRNKPSEYDLDELSPRAQDASPPSKPPAEYMDSSPGPRRPSFGPIRLSDDEVAVPGYNKRKPKVLFAGPPPPIAQSTYMYNDADNYSRAPYDQDHPTFSSTISSVLFDRPQRAQPVRATVYEPDSVWRSIQRRERALQKDLQHFLDVQAAGLSAGLGQPENSPSLGPSSDTDGSMRGSTSRASRSPRLPMMDRSMITGEVIPVRQPRVRKMGLRGARTAIAKSMALLADLKAEEDASLDAALAARKAALAQLEKLSTRRAGITAELRSLEDDDDEPLALELKDLRGEHSGISEQISELEGELIRLKNKRRMLERHIDDVSSRREAGLSGYRGALREVDARVTAILNRPPVKPLDVEAISSAGAGMPKEDIEQDGAPPSTGGVEFLKLRPERRTAEMASDWWATETNLLEARKKEISKDRAALSEGIEVWSEAVQLVTDFESHMRQQVMGDSDPDGSEDGKAKGKGKGKAPMPTPEGNMKESLAKIRPAILALDDLHAAVQEKGWNLLIAAIGAELEAFREVEQIMRDTFKAAGFDGDDQTNPEGSDPPTVVQSKADLNGHDSALVDAGNEDRDAESDNNEVPPDLFSREDSQDIENTPGSPREKDKDGDEVGASGSEQDSNAVPPEFLAEH